MIMPASLDPCFYMYAGGGLIQLLKFGAWRSHWLKRSVPSHFAYEMGISHPLKQCTGPGRPGFYIHKAEIREFTWYSWRLVRSGQRSMCILQNNNILRTQHQFLWQLTRQLVQESLNLILQMPVQLSENMCKLTWFWSKNMVSSDL